MAACAFIDPVCIFFGRELIKVDDGFPLGLFGGVALKRGTTPQTAYIVRVLPEIIDHAVANGAVRNTLARVYDRLGFSLQLVIQVGRLKMTKCAVILRANPIERTFAFNLFQPDIRVFTVRIDLHIYAGFSVRCVAFRCHGVSFRAG